jgi:hypothetical protein
LWRSTGAKAVPSVFTDKTGDFLLSIQTIYIDKTIQFKKYGNKLGI